MKKQIALGALLAIALVLAPGTSQARWMNLRTGRFHTMDTYEGDPQQPLSLHRYLYCGTNPIGRTDPSGKDAAVVNTGGYLGHTCFILTHPQGGVRVYHFYAMGHNGNGNSLENIQGVIYDKDWIWYQDKSSFGAYIEELASTKPTLEEAAWRALSGCNVNVEAYAVGTAKDDKSKFDELNEMSYQKDGGWYSFLGGKECHDASWQWFHEYAGWGGAQVGRPVGAAPIQGLSSDNAGKVKFPSTVYVTRRAMRPSFHTPSISSYEFQGIDLGVGLPY
jgi:hypothetical protein